MSSVVISGNTSGTITLDAPAVAGTTTLTLPATSGTVIVNSGAQTIEFADGSAGAPSITNSGDTNTGMFFPDADTIAFAEGGAEAMRIDSNGNVGIGTTAPGAKLQATGANVGTTAGDKSDLLSLVTSSGNSDLFLFEDRRMADGSSHITTMNFIYRRIDASPMGFIGFGSTGSAYPPLSFGDGSTERMQINSSGSLILAGSTAQKASGTTWSNPSDQRLKDNIRDYTKGTNELMQVRVREWEYNGKGGTTEGLKGLGVVADEVMTVLPNTVETYDAKLNADDEEDTAIKNFDATEITWLLVKTAQEQQQIITDLKATVDAQSVTLNDIKAELDNVKTELATLKGAPQ